MRLISKCISNYVQGFQTLGSSGEPFRPNTQIKEVEHFLNRLLISKSLFDFTPDDFTMPPDKRPNLIGYYHAVSKINNKN